MKTKKPEIERVDIYQRVTNSIIAAIEEGSGTYKMPWTCTGDYIYSPINVSSKTHYRGMNTVILWAEAQNRGYNSGTWGTFKQWQEKGACVRKGETASYIVFWKFFEVEEKTETKKSPKVIPMAKHYCVFNAEQVDGYTPEAFEPKDNARIEDIEAFFASLKIDIRHGGNRAYYRPSDDYVGMPNIEAFHETLGYYSVLAHEATHWTSHPSRLDRKLGERFGDQTYAMEELIAELGAAFLCSSLGLPNEGRKDHAAYVDNWLKVLKNDKRAIFTAASHAQRAVDWMLDYQSEEEAIAA